MQHYFNYHWTMISLTLIPGYTCTLTFVTVQMGKLVKLLNIDNRTYIRIAMLEGTTGHLAS